VVHVERLVLRGNFASSVGHAIGSALEHELARRFAEPGAVANSRVVHIDRLPISVVCLGTAPKSRKIGITIARAISRTFAPGSSEQ